MGSPAAACSSSRTSRSSPSCSRTRSPTPAPWSTTSNAGCGALDEVGRHAARFDAAVVDLGLPDMDGAEVVARLRAACPSLPLVVATGFDAGRAGRSIPAGCGPATVLLKPFDPAVLVATIASLVAEAERGALAEGVAA
jgi:CheY-like chemotaxis protein